jgi:hypothetical protein
MKLARFVSDHIGFIEGGVSRTEWSEGEESPGGCAIAEPWMSNRIT